MLFQFPKPAIVAGGILTTAALVFTPLSLRAEGARNSQDGRPALPFTENGQLTYEEAYRDRPLYVHALVNYDYHPLWQFEWEKNFLNGNGLRLSAGSITSNELLVEGQLTLNQELNKAWRFNAKGLWYANRHQNTRELEIYLGLERQIIRNLSVFLLTYPRFDKEFLDVQVGISLFGKQRENYLTLAYVLEDLVYEEKNDRGGKSIHNPRGIHWFMRYGNGNWWLYGDGRLGSGFERIYPEMEKSPLETAHRQQINQATLKLYYQAGNASLLQLSLHYYIFEEARAFYDSQRDFDYRNNIGEITFHYLWSYKSGHRLRLQFHYLNQEARAIGFSQHDYHRQEFLPAIFYEHKWSNHLLELGYMFSVQDWQYDSIEPLNSYRLEKGYFDKVYLGYSYAFNDNARLHVSISHQLKISGFGGGNVQYIMFF